MTTDPAAPSDAVPVARPLEHRLRTAPVGLDLGGALIGGTMVADAEPPCPTLSTEQQRTINAEVYRLIMGHPYARHDLDARCQRGQGCRTVDTIRARLSMPIRWPR